MQIHRSGCCIEMFIIIAILPKRIIFFVRRLIPKLIVCPNYLEKSQKALNLGAGGFFNILSFII